MRLRAWCQNAVSVLGVALIWLAAYRLNAFVFQSFDYSARVSWVFLPAALRVIAVLLLDNVGVMGLVLGAYLTLPHGAANTWLDEAGLAVSSGVAPLVAVLLCRRFFTLSANLAGLRPWHIAALSVSSALANSITLNSYLAVTGRAVFSPQQALAILVGDISGSMIFLLVLSSVLGLLLSENAIQACRRKSND